MRRGIPCPAAAAAPRALEASFGIEPSRPRRGPHAAVGEGRGTPTSTTRAGPAGRRGVGGGVVVGGMGRSDEARTQRGARGGSGKGGTRPRSGPHGGVGRSGLTCPARPTARDQGGRRDRCVDLLPRNHRGAVPIDSGGKPPIGPWTSLTPIATRKTNRQKGGRAEGGPRGLRRWRQRPGRRIRALSARRRPPAAASWRCRQRPCPCSRRAGRGASSYLHSGASGRAVGCGRMEKLETGRLHLEHRLAWACKKDGAPGHSVIPQLLISIQLCAGPSTGAHRSFLSCARPK